MEYLKSSNFNITINDDSKLSLFVSCVHQEFNEKEFLKIFFYVNDEINIFQYLRDLITNKTAVHITFKTMTPQGKMLHTISDGMFILKEYSCTANFEMTSILEIYTIFESV